MRRNINFYVAVALFLATVFTSCKRNEGDGKFNPSITIFTATSGMVTLKLAGEGNALIDWGQGEKIVEMKLSEYNNNDWVNEHAKFTRTNFFPVATTITVSQAKLSFFQCKSDNVNCISSLIIANDSLHTLHCYTFSLANLDLRSSPNLMFLHCFSNRLSSLDLSRNSNLEWVNCMRNQLTSLDLSNHQKLWMVICQNNNFSKEALNNLFGTLNNKLLPKAKIIYIGDNPGTAECDRSIAEAKGWEVLDYWQ